MFWMEKLLKLLKLSPRPKLKHNCFFQKNKLISNLPKIVWQQLCYHNGPLHFQDFQLLSLWFHQALPTWPLFPPLHGNKYAAAETFFY